MVHVLLHASDALHPCNAQELVAEPAVRNYVRDLYWEAAVVHTQPTAGNEFAPLLEPWEKWVCLEGGGREEIWEEGRCSHSSPVRRLAS